MIYNLFIFLFYRFPSNTSNPSATGAGGTETNNFPDDGDDDLYS